MVNQVYLLTKDIGSTTLFHYSFSCNCFHVSIIPLCYLSRISTHSRTHTHVAIHTRKAHLSIHTRTHTQAQTCTTTQHTPPHTSTLLFPHAPNYPRPLIFHVQITYLDSPHHVTTWREWMVMDETEVSRRWYEIMKWMTWHAGKDVDMQIANFK